jgi:hypothetical protein
VLITNGWPIKREDLQRAEAIAVAILRTVGLQEQGPTAIAATTDARLRAFTLFVRTYDHVRRGISYLRWEQDDVEAIAPSLYQGRGGRKKASTDIDPGVSPGKGSGTVPGTGTGTLPPVAAPATSTAAATGNDPKRDPSSGGPFMT